jgi:hypothetical protein
MERSMTMTSMTDLLLWDEYGGVRHAEPMSI